MTLPLSSPQFDSHAEDYESQCLQGLALSGESKEYFARGRLDFVRRFLQRNAIPSPRTIVDYGCGVGDVTSLLGEMFPDAMIVGVDPSPRCVERAARYRSTRIRFETVAEFGATRLEADLVHTNGVIHHVALEGRGQLFAALRSAVNPGGILALFENNPWNPGTRMVMARIPFDRDASPVSSRRVKQHLLAAGFEMLTTRYLFYFPRPARLLRPLEPWLARLPVGAQYASLARRIR